MWGYWYFSQQSWFQLMLLAAQCFSWCTLHISSISRVTIYSLDVLLFLFGTSLLFHVQLELLLPDLHTDFSRGRSSCLVFPSLSEFSMVYCDLHSQRLWHSQYVDVFLELFCFFNDPADAGSVISGSSAFSKYSSNFWRLSKVIVIKTLYLYTQASIPSPKLN